MDIWKGCEEGSHKLTLLNIDGAWLREGNKVGAGEVVRSSGGNGRFGIECMSNGVVGFSGVCFIVVPGFKDD